MAVRLFFWTVVFDIILRLQGSYAEETCDPGNGKNILIINVQNWEDVLKHEDVQKLISQLETDESVSRIHFNIVEAEAKSHDGEDQEPTPTPMSTTPEHTDIECDKGWYKATDDHCYKLFNDSNKYTFRDAFENCSEELNNTAILAIGIRNLTIRREVLDALNFNQSVSDVRQVWIGLMQNVTDDGNWYWLDGTPMNKTKGENGWKDGEPSDDTSGVDCAALDKNWNFTFTDFRCTLPGYYLCELSHGYNQTAIQNWRKVSKELSGSTG